MASSGVDNNPTSAPTSDQTAVDLDRNPSPGLLRFPPEILHNICLEVLRPSQEGRAWVAALAQTCRALHDIAIPVLYGRVVDKPRWKIDFDDLGWVAGHWEPLINGFRLIRTLALNPALGEQVWAIELRHVPTIWSSADSQAVQAFTVLARQRLGIQGLIPIPSDPIPALVLCSLTPNLTRLVLTAGREAWKRPTDFLLTRANGRITGARRTFQHLAELTIDYSGPYVINLHVYNGLLHAAPNLRSLSLKCVTGGTSMTAQLHNVTTLKLEGVMLCERALKKLTRTCAALAHFEFSNVTEAQRVTHRSNFLPVSPAGILTCLAPAAATLRKLRINNYVEPSRIPPGRPFPRIDSLAGFPALRHVALSNRSIRRPSDNPHRALADLVAGCAELESLYIFNIHRVDEEEFELLGRKVAEHEWLRLRTISLRTDSVERVARGMGQGTLAQRTLQAGEMTRRLEGAVNDMNRVAQGAGVRVLYSVGVDHDVTPFADE